MHNDIIILEQKIEQLDGKDCAIQPLKMVLQQVHLW